RIGGPRVVSAVPGLGKDKDENIRRAAIEELNTSRDKPPGDHQIEATKDKDWWGRERAGDAPARRGDPKALPALLDMVSRNDRSLPIALNAIGKLGDHRILDKVLPYLRRPEKEIRIAAINAVAQLAGEQQADAVRPYIQQSAAVGDDTIARAASRALQKLEGRLTPSGRFTSTIPSAAGYHTPTPSPSPLASGNTRLAARGAAVAT